MNEKKEEERQKEGSEKTGRKGEREEGSEEEKRGWGEGEEWGRRKPPTRSRSFDSPVSIT